MSFNCCMPQRVEVKGARPSVPGGALRLQKLAKTAAQALAEPAHEPGGGGGDPQAHYRIWRGHRPLYRSEPVVLAGCSRCRPGAPFSTVSLGSQHTTRKADRR